MKAIGKKLLNEKKEKVLKYFICFLIFMLFCTIVSRAIYATQLPKVSIDQVKPGNIEHEVKAQGIVEAKDSQAIWTESDLRVASVFVKEGENIEAGAKLFQVDAASLTEKIEALNNEISGQQAQLNASKQNRSQTEQDRQTAVNRANEDKQMSLAAADTAITQAQTEVNDAQMALDQYPPKKDSEDKTAWETEYQTLKQTLLDKQTALGTAVAARSEAEITANRAIEDASKPVVVDASDSVAQLTLEEKQKLLEKYQAIQKAGGIITCEIAGRIATLNVAVGESTPANAAVVLDTAGDMVDFVATITKEEKEYLEDGAKILLKFDKEHSYEDGSVKDLVPLTDETGVVTDNYQLRIEVPSSVAEIGKTGEMTATKTSDLYQSTVPLSAIYTDGNTYYVYILQTTDTILGQETTVIPRNVNLKDKNATLAALDESAGLAEGDSIVIDSTKALSAGGKVRLLGE